MRRHLLVCLTVFSLGLVQVSLAEPEYVRIPLEIDINKPATEVWAKVGAYCDIQQWAGMDCQITSGDGDIGTVRVLAGGRITEIMVAQTELSYGYAQPAVEGQFYNLYHGFMEARPVTENTSKMLYTIMFDVSGMADQSEKDASVERYRSIFTGILQTMKSMSEEG